MRTLTNAELWTKYAQTLDSVTANREAVIVTRPGRDPVVLVPADEYEALRRAVRHAGPGPTR